jgi:predicted HicB family RNase H-like nuclease
MRYFVGGGSSQQLGETMTHDGRIYFRVDARLVAAVEARARQERMSMPEYMRHLIRTNVRAA